MTRLTASAEGSHTPIPGMKKIRAKYWEKQRKSLPLHSFSGLFSLRAATPAG
jgi:hypothetical protein